jgi:ribosomal 50S subunit-recycling heat shock protein
MKKIFIVIFIFSLLSTVSFAKTVADGGTVTIGSQVFTASKGVTVTYTLNAHTYTAESQHAQGQYKFSTDQDSGITKTQLSTGG